MTFLTPAQLMQLGKKCHRCEKRAKWLDKYDENARAYCDEHWPDYDGSWKKEIKEKMIVYVVYITSEVIREILGVFSSLKLAEEKSKDFQIAHRTGASTWDVMIIERQVDE